MINQQHPITPPSELVEQWEAETAHTTKDETWHVAVQAARWGADQELDACCEWLKDTNWDELREAADDLRADRRPEPPSLKEQALEELKHWDDVLGSSTKIIRRALEQLD